MTPETDSPTEPATASKTSGSEKFRRLNWNEQVRRGDFVEDGKQGFELWAGMVGFRADTFVKTIYRRKKISSAAAKASA